MKKNKRIGFLLSLVVVITWLLVNCSQEENNTTDQNNDPILINNKPDTGTMSDPDGNTYKTITIGSQTWMKENLKTTKYSDSTAIPKVTDDSVWSTLTTPAYCWYNNDSVTYKNSCGALYNWYVVSSEKLCPEGWHVPSDNEWIFLENYLIACGFNFDGSRTGDRYSNNKIAKSMADTLYWVASSCYGAVGNSDFPDKRNATDFSALPRGCRAAFGQFMDFGEWSYWWTSTESEGDYAWFRYLQKDCPNIMRYNQIDTKNNGFPVRCMKD